MRPQQQQQQQQRQQLHKAVRLPPEQLASLLEQQCQADHVHYFAACELTVFRPSAWGGSSGRGRGRGRGCRGGRAPRKGGEFEDEGDCEEEAGEEEGPKPPRVFLVVKSARNRCSDFRYVPDPDPDPDPSP